MSDKHYLAKDGKTYGPYDSKTLETLKSSGEFYSYEWMWDGVAPNWSPVPRKVKGPPPIPVTSSQKSEPTSTTKKKKSAKTYCAIAFDNRTTVSVTLTDMHDSGGLLVSTIQGAQAFPKGAQVWLDVLDEESDQAGKVRAKIEATSIQNGLWHYTVSWNKFPFDL